LNGGFFAGKALPLYLAMAYVLRYDKSWAIRLIAALKRYAIPEDKTDSTLAQSAFA
jgi:hypothetical protein